MTTLTEIIKRLNQRIEVSNIFDRIFGLCETNPKGKGFVHYNGNGQAQIVTDYDAKRGTIFWIKRGDVTTSEDSVLKISGCKKMYKTAFPLTAYCVVLKSHLPCDNSESEDWIGGQVNRFLAGMDNGFKASLGVASYEVVPNKYSVTTKDLPENLEWACLTVDFTVNITTDSAANCYDLCTTEPIPLPPAFEPCQPCLTSVSVDGVTIIGNGTPNDPLIATGVVAGGSIIVEDEGIELTPTATTLNFTGTGVTASLTSPGVVEVNVNAQSGGVTDVTATAPMVSTGGVTPNLSMTMANAETDGWINAEDWYIFNNKFDKPTGATTDYLDGQGTPKPFPTIPTETSQLTNDSGFITIADVPTQVNADWNAVGGVAEILNKPAIQPPLGFTPEDVAKKSTDVATDQASNTKYPSVKAVFDWATSVFTTASAVATQITAALTGYATQAWVTSQGYLTAITSGQVTTALGFTPVTNARTITINGTTQDLSANRTWNIGATIWKTGADSSSFASTANTAVYTQLIDANTFVAGDLVRVSYRTRKTGTAGAQTLRIYVNATPDLTGSPVLCGVATVGTTTVLLNQMQRHFAIKSATTNTEVYSASGSVATDFGQLPSFTAAAINWTAARYFVFAIQNSNAGDTNFGSFYAIEKL